MLLRVVRAQAKPGQAPEMAQRWENRIRQSGGVVPGVRHAIFGIEEGGDRTIAVVIFDGDPDEAQFQPMMAAMQADLGELITGPPEVTRYQVAVQR